MKNSITHHRTPARRHPAAFTLTEVMIALAMVALLLVGISRIFAITSATISSGQALSQALRAQRAVQQALSADLYGVGPLPGQSDSGTGMVQLGGGPGNSAPMLFLSSFRVAAYRNAADAASDVGPAVAGESFANRSLHIRTIDANSNGVDTDPGETISLYNYGQRNWRVDSLGFFGQGNFTSQTGNPATVSATLQNTVKSTRAWIWYGHLAVFNGQANRLPWQNAFGLPGQELTQNSTTGPTPQGMLPNSNNQYADQFLLGRFQLLLVPPTDHDSDGSSTTPTPETVVAPDLSAIPFIQKNYTSPSQTDSSSAPFTESATVRYFNYASSPRVNAQIGQNDELLASNYSASPPSMKIENCRADIAGVDMGDYYERMKFFQTNIYQDSGLKDRRAVWWGPLFARFTSRYWINPFPGTSFNSKAVSQRSQLLTPGCTQFIVEYSGDFLTQDANGVVDQAAPIGGDPDVWLSDPRRRQFFQPDGVTDFVVINGARQTRWYGMPRDVDGDGVIAGNTTSNSPPAGSAIYRSPDVVPLRDLLGGRMLIFAPGGAANDFRPFEVAAPIAAADYGAVYAETANATNAPPFGTAVLAGATANVESTSYICAWGPLDFETKRPLTNASNPLTAPTRRPVPTALRVIVDMVDTQGKMAEPLRQESVYPVPVAP